MNIADALAATPVSTLDLSRYLEVEATATVAGVVEAMASAGKSCACVVGDDGLAGIFTQRDALVRVIGRPAAWGRPIAEEMSTPVRTMSLDQSVADGLALMTEWWVRNVPVLNADGNLAGNLTFYAIIREIGRLLAGRLDEHAAELGVEHTLAFVDFTGLPSHHPVTVGMDDTADVAAHHMRARGIGSVVVVDERGALMGMLTEFDLLTKVGVGPADLATLTVKELMTPDPVALPVRSPIAAAIREVAEHEFSHVPLLGESGRPVGMASFRDLAAYVETSLDALG